MRVAGFIVLGLLAGCMPPSQGGNDYYYQGPPQTFHQPPPAQTPPPTPPASTPTRTVPLNPHFHPSETRPTELPGGPLAPSSFKPAPAPSRVEGPTRACAMCNQPAEAGWVYCPVDGARIPDLNAPDSVERGMKRIVYEYADGTQRLYAGEHAAKISKIEMDLLNHWVNSGQTTNPYSGLAFKEISPKGKVLDKSIP